ncbi:MAG: hypothetical protein QOE51_1663 [Actinoplanes sp.]|jgi:hypothetical protein|nr:hypothetical protein [Actinoplanes sp.]
MRCLIRVPAPLWRHTRDYLLAVGVERMAYLLARASMWDDPWEGPTVDLLVRQALLVPNEVLSTQTPTAVEIEPGFTREVLRACYETGLSLVDIHTHPFSASGVAFSGHDRANMRTTHAEFRREIPQEPPALAASLVVGRDAVAGAWLDPHTGRLADVAALQLLDCPSVEVPLCRR